jgi:predicted permease
MIRFPKFFRHSPNLGANLTIVALLALGLGSATLLYTAMVRLLLDPLPGLQAENLVRLAVKRPKVVSRSFPVTLYEAAAGMQSFTGLAAESDFDTALTSAESSRRIVAGMVSDNYFTVLGAHAALGRELTAAWEHGAADAVPVVLSHRFWMRAFAGSSAALGRTINLAGRPFTVTGVMPQNFYGTALDSSPDLWIPFAAQPLLSQKSLRDPEPDRAFNIIGRLRDGVSLAQAQSEFTILYEHQEAAAKDTNPGQGILEPIAQGAFHLHDQFARALALLMSGIAVFLVIVCANVASLLLLRAARRERETAIRMALGAGRGNVLARALTESLSLGLAGAAVALACAYLLAPAVARLLPYSYTPLPVSLAPDWIISLMAIGIAVAISLIFGFAPAWHALQIAPQRALRGGSSTRRSGASSRVLLVVQTALTLVLLVAAGLLLRTFETLRSTRPGFDTGHIVTFTVDPSMAGKTGAPAAQVAAELERRVRQLPAVRDAGFATAEPLHRIGLKTSVGPPGHRISDAEFLNTSMNSVSSSFFSTMGIPILAGRVFSPADAQRASPMPVVVNQAFARHFYPGQDPVGKIFGQGVPGEVVSAKFVVIGLAGDAKYRTLRETPPPTYYAPLETSEDWDSTLFLYVRTRGEPQSVIGAVRDVLFHLDARLPFFDVVTMQEQIAESLWQERMLAFLAAALSLCAILMAAAGLYALLSYDSNQRQREFGIRAAVGARRIDVAALVLRDLLRILVPGMAVGLVSSYFLARLLSSTLYNIRPDDSISLASAVALILLIGVVAGWRPIYTAIRTDPAIVLRDE